MNDWVFIATAGIFSLLIGSFLNVVIHRGPAIWGLLEDPEESRGSLMLPRSYCPSCKQTLRIIDLIPVLSYLLLRGRCAFCKAPISMRYPIVELMGAVAGAAAYKLAGPTVDALFIALFFWSLIALAFIDFDIGYLPDAITLPLLWLGLIANLNGRFVPLQQAVIGAAAGYLIFRGLGALYQRIRQREGLGQGDTKLLAALGAWTGWPSLAPIVFIASIVALVTIAGATIAGRAVKADSEIPFGPYLAIAGAFALNAVYMELI